MSIFIRSQNVRSPCCGTQRKRGRKPIWRIALVALALGSCGDGGSGSGAPPPITVTPTPAPTPTPTPTPAPAPAPVFQPLIGQLFSDTQNLHTLHVAGRGWKADFVPNGNLPSTNIRDGGTVLVNYDIGSNSYRLDVPQTGTGTLYQMGNPYARLHAFGQGFDGALASDAAAAASAGRRNLYVLKARTENNRFTDVALLTWYDNLPAGGNLQTASVGVVGIARPSPASALAGFGARRYEISSFAYIGGNFADAVGGQGSLDINLPSGAIAGSLTQHLQCFMGCAYPTSALQFVNSQVTPGSLNFSGELAATGTSIRGTYNGIFVGPNADEILISYETPYFYQERSTWVTIRGVILGRVA